MPAAARQRYRDMLKGKTVQAEDERWWDREVAKEEIPRTNSSVAEEGL